jgi:FKBP-type peptidyl-prolyl cis-trans isomerase 2
MIKNGSRVSIEYTLTLDDDSVADTNVGGDPLVYEHGAGQILPALEAQLEGLSVDDTRQIKLSAAEGYGPVHGELFQTIKPELLPEDARQVGTRLVSEDENGDKKHLRVHEVHADKIVLDFNHELAGRALLFDVKILAIEP